MDGNIKQAHEQVERPLGTRWHEKLRHAFGGIALPTSAGRQRGRGGPMNAKQILAGVALLGTIATGLAGLQGEAGGAPRTAHADAPTPTIAPLEINPSPLSIDALGTNFAPGAPVHIDLVLAYWHNVPDITPTPDESGNPPVSPVPAPTLFPGAEEGASQIVASVDTRASYARNFPVGNGHFFRIVGGSFDVNLTSPSSTCGEFSYWLVVTNAATGRTYTGDEVREYSACN